MFSKQKTRIKKAATGTGHVELVADVLDLLIDILNFQFHDFKNDQLAFPKVSLVNALGRLANEAKNGRYDDTGDDMKDSDIYLLDKEVIAILIERMENKEKERLKERMGETV